jgi:hypothetical protein
LEEGGADGDNPTGGGDTDGALVTEGLTDGDMRAG